jgi:hypothetical protein
MDGLSGDPGQYRDYRLRLIMQDQPFSGATQTDPWGDSYGLTHQVP